MTLSRRAFVAGGVALGIGAGIGVPLLLSATSPASTGAVLSSRLPRPDAFRRRLRIPPELRPLSTSGSADVYAITARPGSVRILDDRHTTVFGYEGSFPGPTLRTRAGRPIVVRHRNELPVPTVVHLHGGHTPHDSDGYPTDLILPADPRWFEAQQLGHEAHLGVRTTGERAYAYPLQQRAATLWYHDHRMDFTGPAVWRGLAGFHLIEDDEERELGLPSRPRELPLMLTDRSFERDGEFRYPSLDPTLVNFPGVEAAFAAGVLGDVMLVNGVPWPFHDVQRGSYRLRILNACNARRLRLRLDPAPDDGLVQIGSDGGLLGAPIAHEGFDLAPAQRLDAVVDFSGYPAGTAVDLLDDNESGSMRRIMRFVVGRDSAPVYRLPTRLSDIEVLTRAEATVRRSLTFRRGDVRGMSGWVIGGAPFDPAVASVRPRLGEVELWQLFADFHHPVHVHLDPFQVLSRGIGGPGAGDAGWKDTIDLRPSEQAEILVRFTDYEGRFVFHCHNLEHEDMGMMANFETRR